MTTDAFHPDPGHPHPYLRHVPAGEIDGETAQTVGMRRYAGISQTTVGSERLWMGQTQVPAAARRTTTRRSRPVVVIARSTQEAIVVNLPSLRATTGSP